MEPPQETSRPANTTENRGGRAHSLYAVPVLGRSPYGNPDNAKGSEISSIQTTQDRGRTPKDKGQEGTGNRLLNMLRKTLKGAVTEEVVTAPETPTLVPFGDVVGCLAIHIRNCRHFTTKINFRRYTDLFIRISINKVVKSTKICSLLATNNAKNVAIKFDEVKYFSVQVPRRHDDERNNIYLELMHYDNIKNCPLLLGSVQIHLYEVIQVCIKIIFFTLFICRLEVECMFSYGNFGYGFSHQLKPFQKTTEPSMFVNTTPPPERTDPVTKVIMPQPVEYPAFLSPDLNVTVGTQTEHPSNQPSVVKLEKLQQPPRESLLEQDNSATVSPKSDESTPSPTDIPLTIIPRVEITEEDNIPPLYPCPSEVLPARKMKNLLYPRGVKLKARYPSISKTESSPSEVKLRS
uniref:C2 domain-containing protein n=1 Tax=Propithecus coquereli TaxID=379532 RepID=A0A2K6FPS6_PROCO